MKRRTSGIRTSGTRTKRGMSVNVSDTKSSMIDFQSKYQRRYVKMKKNPQQHQTISLIFSCRSLTDFKLGLVWQKHFSSIELCR